MRGQRASTGRKSASNRGRKPPPTRATRSLVASRPALRGVRDLEPHQIDVLALALVAIGIFLAGVTYGFWAGGSLGHGVLSGLQLLIGKLAYLIPIALILGGARILARDLDVAPATRPLRSGTICLSLALALAFAAGTLGLGPGATPAHGAWSAAVLKPRGGLVGGLEYDVSRHLLSTAGADILAVFLIIAGAILLSGATFASVINGSRRHATTALGRDPEASSATRRAEIRAARLRDDDDAHPSMVVPDPQDAQLVVRATHVEAPPIDVYEDADGQRSFVTDDAVEAEDGLEDVTALADGSPIEFEDFVDLDEVDEDEPAAEYEPEADGETGPGREVDPRELTPAGRYRASVTDDPDFVWRVPSARFLVRSTGEAAKPDTDRSGADREGPGRGAGSLRDRVEGRRPGQRSAYHSL